MQCSVRPNGRTLCRYWADMYFQLMCTATLLRTTDKFVFTITESSLSNLESATVSLAIVVRYDTTTILELWNSGFNPQLGLYHMQIYPGSASTPSQFASSLFTHIISIHKLGNGCLLLGGLYTCI